MQTPTFIKEKMALSHTSIARSLYSLPLKHNVRDNCRRGREPLRCVHKLAAEGRPHAVRTIRHLPELLLTPPAVSHLSLRDSRCNR